MTSARSRGLPPAGNGVPDEPAAATSGNPYGVATYSSKDYRVTGSCPVQAIQPGTWEPFWSVAAASTSDLPALGRGRILDLTGSRLTTEPSHGLAPPDPQPTGVSNHTMPAPMGEAPIDWLTRVEELIPRIRCWLDSTRREIIQLEDDVDDIDR